VDNFAGVEVDGREPAKRCRLGAHALRIPLRLVTTR
jgi:hypothetical protein